MNEPSIHYTMDTYRRKIANARMGQFRSIPVARRAWHVKLTAITASRDFLEVVALKSLAQSPQSFWVRRRMAAQRIVKLDHESGGDGEATAVEFRRCCVCKRVLIGGEAHDYQQKMRRPLVQWEFKNGPSCGVECQPRKGKINAALS